MEDIIIIGGGPAGLTAGIYARRSGKRVLLLEKAVPGGQLTSAPLVENYPGIPHISGMELARKMQEQAEELGVEIRNEEVISLEKSGDIFRVGVFGGIFEAKAVILATGVKHRGLELPGEEELVGSGLSFCAVCDGPFCGGQEVAVVGGGDTALQDAIFLAGICSRVTVIHRRGSFRAEAGLVEKVKKLPNVRFLMPRTLSAYLSDNGFLTGLRLHDAESGKEEEYNFFNVFLAIGQIPENEAFASLTQLTPAGYFRADAPSGTETPGLFAAGDCCDKPLRQVTTACSDGARAAVAACSYLDSPA